jgi:antitoxin CcdA
MMQRVTVELDDEAVAAARAAKIDLSELLTSALRRRLPILDTTERARASHEWYEANKEAVDAYNKLVDEHGLFSDGIRMF